MDFQGHVKQEEEMFLDIQELFQCCRRGDIARVMYLVEVKDINVNIRDKWDSTPLYYACLCGHMEIVQYLLAYGARCEANSFDGERCLYGALTEQIQCTKPGTNVKTLILESEELLLDVQQDLGVLALQAIPQELRTWACADELPLMPAVPLHLVDLCFLIDKYKFWCHKAFFCSRSEYFNALLRDHFSETEIDDEIGVPLVRIKNVPVEAFAAVVYYVYTNFVQVHPDYILDMLFAADMYLLHSLKRACGLQLINFLSIHNVVSRLRTARLFQLSYLEDQCTKFIAYHIDKMCNDPSLHELILQDAQDVKERQETDSIPVVDDIRYHITCDVHGYSGMSEASEQLKIIDKMLECLGLDA